MSAARFLEAALTIGRGLGCGWKICTDHFEVDLSSLGIGTDQADPYSFAQFECASASPATNLPAVSIPYIEVIIDAGETHEPICADIIKRDEHAELEKSGNLARELVSEMRRKIFKLLDPNRLAFGLFRLALPV